MISGGPEGYFGRFWEPGKDNSAMGLEFRGWLDGCPNPQAVAKQYTIDWAIARYFECSLVAAYILDLAQKINPQLATQLSSTKLRLPGEDPHNFDPHAVPNDYYTKVSPGSGIPGYAASRAWIEYVGRKPAWEIGSPKVKRGQRILRRVLKEANDPIYFTVVLCEELVKAGADPTAVLGHLLAVEHLDEGLYTDIKKVWECIIKHAPKLWIHYLMLGKDAREKAGILEIFAIINKL